MADGRQRYRGLELSAQGQLTRQLAWQLSAQSAGCGVPRHQRPVQRQDAGEHRQATASAFLSYDIAAVPGLSVNGGAYYTGKRPIDDLNQGFIGGYTIFAAGARYVTKLFGKRTLWQLNIDNLGDKRYWSAAGTRLAVGVPRTIKATVKVDL